MREDNEVSRPSTILCSTRRVAQLRPVRLDPSAYPSRPDATETQSRAQSSMISGSAQTAVADTNGTAGKHSATADVSRFTRVESDLLERGRAHQIVRTVRDSRWTKSDGRKDQTRQSHEDHRRFLCVRREVRTTMAPPVQVSPDPIRS
jgi:hypothetical protein